MQSCSFLLFRFTDIQTSSHNSFVLIFPCCTLPASFLWLLWLLALHLGKTVPTHLFSPIHTLVQSPPHSPDSSPTWQKNAREIHSWLFLTPWLLLVSWAFPLKTLDNLFGLTLCNICRALQAYLLEPVSSLHCSSVSFLFFKFCFIQWMNKLSLTHLLCSSAPVTRLLCSYVLLPTNHIQITWSLLLPGWFQNTDQPFHCRTHRLVRYETISAPKTTLSSLPGCFPQTYFVCEKWNLGADLP